MPTCEVTFFLACRSSAISYVFFDRYRGADFPKTFHPFTKMT